MTGRETVTVPVECPECGATTYIEVAAADSRDGERLWTCPDCNAPHWQMIDPSGQVHDL